MNSPHKGQWRGALMFSLICVWINDWVSNRETGDLRRHRGHYDVIVMIIQNRPSNVVAFGIYNVSSKQNKSQKRKATSKYSTRPVYKLSWLFSIQPYFWLACFVYKWSLQCQKGHAIRRVLPCDNIIAKFRTRSFHLPVTNNRFHFDKNIARHTAYTIFTHILQRR